MVGCVNLGWSRTVLLFDLVATILMLQCMLVEISPWLISFQCVLFLYPPVMLLDGELLIATGCDTE